MFNLNFYRALVFGSIFPFVLVVAGCATNFPQKSEDVVKARAQERVIFLKSKEFSKAYQYLTPSYRALNNLESYRNSFGSGAEWIDPIVSRVDCSDEDRCVAELKLGVLVLASGFGGKPLPTTLREIWIKENGQWWFQQYSNN